MKSIEFNPISDHILVKPVPLETGEAVSNSGIVVELEQNNSIIDRPTEGTVVAVGKDAEEIKPGMFVMWLETDGQDIELEDGAFLILKERSVLGYKEQ